MTVNVEWKTAVGGHTGLVADGTCLLDAARRHGIQLPTECGKTIEFFSAELEAIQDAIVAKHKFRPTQHSLRIFGVCAQCQRKTDVPTDESAAEPRIRFASAPNTQ